MDDFQDLTNKELQRLFQEDRKHDKLSFLFTVLGINSGMATGFSQSDPLPTW